MARLLEGKIIADQMKDVLSTKVKAFGKRIQLASIQLGENPACDVYVKAQERVALLLGVHYKLHKLSKETTEAKLCSYIEDLNQDAQVHGIIIQRPLPLHVDFQRASQLIAPKKDVEGMHPENLGNLIMGKATIIPCTALAVMELLNSTGISLSGKDAVIVGHSEIVGKPLALLLMDKLATVSVCHIGTSKAGRLEEFVRRAEILAVSVGKAGLIKGEWIKEDSIVIDVGINKVGDKIYGDVEFEEAQKRAGWITPVPGGVGPLTVMMLMKNLVECAKALAKR